jgi:hypothetical protein
METPPELFRVGRNHRGEAPYNTHDPLNLRVLAIDIARFERRRAVRVPVLHDAVMTHLSALVCPP